MIIIRSKIWWYHIRRVIIVVIVKTTFFLINFKFFVWRSVDSKCYNAYDTISVFIIHGMRHCE
jgi:hypothetical protein